MKNFLKFLLVFVGVILVYIYNNPDVINKYKNDVMNSAEPDSAMSVEKNEADSVIEKVPVVEKKKVEANKGKSKSRKPIVRDKYTMDTATINALKCHFTIEKYNGADYYIPKCAPKYSKIRCFYAYLGVFNNRQVSTNLNLKITAADSVNCDITKLCILADGDKFEIPEKSQGVQGGYNGGFTTAFEFDLSKYQDVAWALYYADSAKVIYEKDGKKMEMAVTSEELQYFRYSMDFYRSWIRCPKCVF